MSKEGTLILPSVSGICRACLLKSELMSPVSYDARYKDGTRDA